MKNYSFSTVGKRLCLNFNEYNYWESIEDIIQIVKQNYNIKITDFIDGPDSRICKLKINNYNYSLIYNSYGSYLKSLDEIGDAFLYEIYNKLSADCSL